MRDLENPGLDIHFCPICRSLYRRGQATCERDGARLERLAETDPWCGLLLSRAYRVVRSIGTGEVGRIYEAIRIVDGDRVAVEMLFVDGPRGRLAREAERLARAPHPNLVRVLEGHFEPDQPPYLVMELVDDPTLEALVTALGPMPPERALRITRGILEGLDHLHGLGIVHGHLEPGNVFIDVRGGFDLARISAIASDGPFGSPAYLAPEQLLGREPGPSADLYALGATLFAMLEGRPPNVASGADVVGWSALPLILEPRRASRPLADLVQRLTDLEPTRRLSSARAVLAAIDGLIAVSEAPTREMPVAWSRRSLGLLGRVRVSVPWLLASVLLALLGLGLSSEKWRLVRGSEPVGTEVSDPTEERPPAVGRTATGRADARTGSRPSP